MKFNIKSRKGFALIELLVVIGILAVLAAIAIPSVAGLIDRANVSADKTNSNEMTNAVERFASEYELYCQDIASGALDPNNLDSAQGRVKNVVGATTRSEISAIEFTQDATVANDVVAIYRDTKYPMNAYTMQKVVKNYTKTSSSTFEPKQSDMHFWYSPDCGVVVFAEPDADQDKENKLNSQIKSGMDAKGNKLSASAQLIDLTLGVALSGGNSASLPEKGKTLEQYTWEEVRDIVTAGKAGEYGFAVGGTKTLQINDATKTATIIGLNHDGSNTATFMILSEGGIGTYKMNDERTNVGGWEASKMRTWLNNDIFNSMIDTKDYIKTTIKMTSNIDESVTSTLDNVFLLSVKECGEINSLNNNGSVPYAYMSQLESEGETYELFLNGIPINEQAWTRSRYINNNNGGFFFCKLNGIPSGPAAIQRAVYPAFVIG